MTTNDVIFGTTSAMAAGVGLVAVLCYGATMLSLETGLGDQQISHAVSEHGVGPTAGRFRLAAGLTTVAGVALALALLATSAYDLTSRPVVTLAVVTLARLGVMALPTDLPGERRTMAGWGHLLAAIVQFGGLYRLITGDGAGIATATGQGWFVSLTDVLAPTVTVALIAVCVGLVLPKVRRLFGLCERLFLAATTVWVLAACAATLVAAVA